MHSLRAAAAIAATVCLAAGAVSAQQMDMPVRRDGHVIRPAAASGRVAEAQRQLRSEGLYRGPIDGVMTRQTRAAIADFQLRDGLPQTATLDDDTLERLRHRRTTAGSGSSTPPAVTVLRGTTPAPNLLTPPLAPAPNGSGGNTANQ